MKNKIINIIKTIILSLILSFSVQDTSYAATDQDYINNVLTQQQINRSNLPKYADRDDSSESIDPITGDLTLNQTDINLPGKDGLDLSIGRVYHSSEDECVKKAYISTEPTKIPVLKYRYYVHYTAVTPNGSTTMTVGPLADYASACSVENSLKSNSVITNVGITSEAYYEYEDGTKVVEQNLTDKYAYNKIRYYLGAGWSFTFPSVEIEGNVLYYHDGQGSSYKVSGTTDTGKSNLEGYQGNDVKFLADNGSYVNEDNVSSKYVFISSDMTKTYFAEDGRILGIRDRFNNIIKFKHTSVKIYDKTFPLISQITDTVGRVVTFSYSGNNIDLTVTAPGTTDQIHYSYVRSFATKQIYDDRGTMTEYQYPILDHVTDSLNRNTYYQRYSSNYTWPSEAYSFLSKNKDKSMDRYLIGAVVYPGSKTVYDYEKYTINLGKEGISDAYRIKSRSDSIQRKNSSTQALEWIGDNNKVTYSYNGDYSGYPTYQDQSDLPDDYTFSTTTTSSDGYSTISTTTSTFNCIDQLIEQETTASNNEKQVTDYWLFDSNYIYLPQRIDMVEYASNGSVGRVLAKMQTYTA